MCLQTITKSANLAPVQAAGFFQTKDEWFDRGEWSRSFSIPDVNIFENRNEYKISIAAEGLNENDINIDDLGKTISVCFCGQKKNRNQKNYGEDFCCSSFSLSFPKPHDVIQNKVVVSYENGILNICLQKKTF